MKQAGPGKAEKENIFNVLNANLILIGPLTCQNAYVIKGTITMEIAANVKDLYKILNK